MADDFTGLTPITKTSEDDFSGLTPVQPEAEPGALEALGRGAASGLTIGTAPMISGAVEAGMEKLGGSTEDLANLYRRYQEASAKRFEAAKTAHPYAYGTGAIGGGLLPIVATSGLSAPAMTLRGAAELGGMTLAKEVGKRAAIGAGEGAVLGGISAGAESQGKSIGLRTQEDENQLVNDIKKGIITGGSIGGSLGLVASGLGIGANELLKKMSTSEKPFLRNIASSFKMGEEGVNLSSEKQRLYGTEGKGPLIQEDSSNAKNLLDKIVTADEDLGQKVGQSLENAHHNGIAVNISDELSNSAGVLDDLFQKNPALAGNEKARRSLGKIFNKPTDLTPLEAKSALDEMDSVLNTLKGDTSTVANATRKVVGDFRRGLNEEIKSSIPEYAESAGRFEKFRELIPETIISGAKPQELSGVYYGKLKNKEGELFDSIKDLIQGATKPGDTSSQEAFARLVQGAKSLEGIENAKLNQGQIESSIFDNMGVKNSDDLISSIKKQSDESQVRQTMFGAPPTPPGGSLKATAARNIIGYGKGEIYNVANKLGQFSKLGANSQKLSEKVYNMDPGQLQQMAQSLMGVPGMKNVVDSLQKGITEKNEMVKNAALFSLMQNPKAREAIYTHIGGESVE